jgi:thiosulfate reductase cytochrome b subunit
VVYVLYLVCSGEWRKVLPDRHSLRDALLVTLHDLHIIKDAPLQGLYNGAQRLAYTGVILMAIGSVVTGLAIYKPVQLAWLAGLLGGYPTARWIHFWLMIGFLSFFVVHLAQVVRAGRNNFRSMVAGFSIEADVQGGGESHS